MNRRCLALALALLMIWPCSAARALTLSLVGDCSIGTIRYREKSTDFISKMKKQGMDYPFSKFYDVFQNDDLTIANCEGVFTTLRAAADKNKLSIYALPEWAQVFTLGAVDVVNTENNHTYDFGKQGRLDTLAALDEAGIAHFGGGELLIIEVEGITIGMTGYTYPHRYDISRQEKDIEKLRSEGCEIIIVSMHWGKEESYKLTAEQKQMGRALIDAGADVVYGHGPHVLQPVEMYNGKPIIYSLANFTFGANAAPKDADTAVLTLVYEREEDAITLTAIDAIPARMHNNKDFCPYPYTEGKDIERVLKKLDMQGGISLP
jgi:Putative enzyme of poly-gamma-glutamate biosynthesis (capsule formation)